MFSKKDIKQIEAQGTSVQKVEQQLEDFERGFPFLKILKAAEVSDSIMQLSETDKKRYIESWHSLLKDNRDKIVQFVPASGAASRMFKDLFAFVDTQQKIKSVGTFFYEIEKFAFYNQLNEKCRDTEKKDAEELLNLGEFSKVLSVLLNQNGLNYGNLPKGLLLFHQYPSENRTPFLEHLAEGVAYAKNADNQLNLHFTVSPEHVDLFKNHLADNIERYENRYNVGFNISFSVQKKSTDTIAANAHNEPFRDKDGSLVFRPGGHGALIANLNELNGDIAFIKNIDNVVIDRLKQPTIDNKKIIGGILFELKKQCFAYLKELENPEISEAKLRVIAKFSESRLFNFCPEVEQKNKEQLREYLFGKLNRPIRVCGMVKNEGEPGGGPYLVYNQDGTISPQILEASQIDVSNAQQRQLMEVSTHFNPVDLVCCLTDYKGKKFNLFDYIDNDTCFVSLKSKNGQELKALELPGLWNGAMSNWNTVFVEVPIETFNPVKTVNDLLRMQHRI